MGETFDGPHIHIGDAVEVAQWPCCGYKVGQRFRVNAMEQASSGFMRCANCGVRHPSERDALGPFADWIPVAWLKRLDDPDTYVPQGTMLG